MYQSTGLKKIQLWKHTSLYNGKSFWHAFQFRHRLEHILQVSSATYKQTTKRLLKCTQSETGNINSKLTSFWHLQCFEGCY